MTAHHALKLYRHPLSGNAHRVELFLHLLNLDYEQIDVDLMGGEQKSESLRALNPKGQVPVLIDGDDVILESTAILVYLATKYDNGVWLPQAPEAASAVQFWLTRTNTDIANGPAAARLVSLFGAPLDRAAALATGKTALAELEQTLSNADYLAATHATIADVAVYAYVAHAPEGGLSLAPYPNVLNWISRIQSLPGFVPMQSSTIPDAA
tara:strand:- start:577 stop:1206 length:630 start_codon:yes stop_codon:yes gene_type:complete